MGSASGLRACDKKSAARSIQAQPPSALEVGIVPVLYMSVLQYPRRVDKPQVAMRSDNGSRTVALTVPPLFRTLK